eukprot:14656079-Alexandrium_andersonii.AAC.1
MRQGWGGSVGCAGVRGCHGVSARILWDWEGSFGPGAAWAKRTQADNTPLFKPLFVTTRPIHHRF